MHPTDFSQTSSPNPPTAVSGLSLTQSPSSIGEGQRQCKDQRGDAKPTAKPNADKMKAVKEKAAKEKGAQKAPKEKATKEKATQVKAAIGESAGRKGENKASHGGG